MIKKEEMKKYSRTKIIHVERRYIDTEIGLSVAILNELMGIKAAN